MHNLKAESTTSEGLVRVMDTRALSLSIVNMIVGAGIFVLPGILAGLLGPGAILAYLICSVAVALVFLCFAEAGSRVTRSGGAYAYIADAFGPFAGFLASILLWFGWGILSNAAVAIALVEVAVLAFPVLDGSIPRGVFLIVLFAGLATLNIRGVKAGVQFVVLNTYLKLIPLIVLVAWGGFFVEWGNLLIVDLPTLESLGAGTLILVFAFGGAEVALNAGGEIKNPSKTVPLGLLFGFGIVFVLYVAIQSVAQGVLGPDLALNVEAPLIATAEQAFGPWGRTFMLVGAGISIFGVTAGHVLNHPRALFGTARDGLLPKQLAVVHPRFKTPHVAIIVCTTLTCAIAMTGAFKTLAVVSSGSVLLLYLGCSLAVLKLRQSNPAKGDGVFVIPGGPAVPLASSAIVIWLLTNMTAAEALGLGLLLAVSGAAYFLMPRRARPAAK